MLDSLPDTDTWEQDARELAQSLVDGIDPADRDQLAALGMLLQQGPEVWAQPTFTAHFSLDRRPTARPGARMVDWNRLAYGTAHLGTLTADTRFAVQLACSMADPRVRCCLGEALAALSPANRARFRDMTQFMVGVA